MKDSCRLPAVRWAFGICEDCRCRQCETRRFLLGAAILLAAAALATLIGLGWAICRHY